MFFPIPMELTRSGETSRIPLANMILIAINVLVYLLFSPANWWVGPGTMPWTILTYGFVHVSFSHLLFNLWYLWVFGNAVNRRIGNTYYLIAVLGAIVLVGCIARLLSPGYVLGSSVAVYTVLGIAVLLMPSSRVEVHYLAVFPLTLLLGLFRWPKYGFFWFLRWGTCTLPSVIFIGSYVILECFWLLWMALHWNMSWSNLGHLLGFFCGVAAVLLLPSRVSLRRPASF